MRLRFSRLTFLIIVLGCVAGCLVGCLTEQPEVGPVSTGQCSNEDSDPEAEVSFALEVRPLLVRTMGGCSCHQGRSTSGFDLGSYESLLRGGINSGTRVVMPGKPCTSIVAQKLGDTPPFGSRMPFNGPPYFAHEELQLIRDWIAEGALDN